MGTDDSTWDAIEHGRLSGLVIDDVDAQDVKGRRNYLHIAAGEGQIESVRWLLARNPTVDGTTGLWTPLHSAAEMGFTEICELLVAAGADPSAVEWSRVGGTPLVLALFYGHAETADALAAHALVPRNLRTAAGLGRVDLLEALHGTPEAGAEREWYRPHDGFPEWVSTGDDTELLDEALVYAAANGRIDAVRWLLAWGARADAIPYWANALHLAIGHGRDEVMEVLLATGPDLGVIDRMHDGTAAGWADYAGRKDLVERFTVDPGSTDDPKPGA